MASRLKSLSRGEVEVVLIGPGLLGEGRVGADAQHLGVQRIQGVVPVAEGAHLVGAYAGERAGEEGQHHVLALEVAQLALLTVEIVKVEVRGCLTNIRCHSPFLRRL